MNIAMPNCLRLFKHWTRLARSLALAITTRSSMRVNALRPEIGDRRPEGGPTSDFRPPSSVLRPPTGVRDSSRHLMAFILFQALHSKLRVLMQKLLFQFQAATGESSLAPSLFINLKYLTLLRQSNGSTGRTRPRWSQAK